MHFSKTKIFQKYFIQLFRKCSVILEPTNFLPSINRFNSQHTGKLCIYICVYTVIRYCNMQKHLVAHIYILLPVHLLNINRSIRHVMCCHWTLKTNSWLRLSISDNSSTVVHSTTDDKWWHTAVAWHSGNGRGKNINYSRWINKKFTDKLSSIFRICKWY